MALMTEPSKFVDNDTNPYYFVTGQVEDNLELLEEDDAVRAEVNTKINTFLEWFGSSVKTFVKA